jgi:hypothetical protein
MREDNKGLNLIQVAAKSRYFSIIEYLMKAGVSCPPDIKRKIERNKTNSQKTNTTRSTREKKEEVQAESAPEEEKKEGFQL